MTRMEVMNRLGLGLFLVLLAGCVSNPNKEILESSTSQVQLRSMQTRAFDTSDRDKMMRSVISTLQDLSFVIDKADSTLGTVSGTKYGKSGYAVYTLRMTVTVRNRGESQLLVRASAQYNLDAVEDPEIYQGFFDSLGKSLFLTAHQVE